MITKEIIARILHNSDIDSLEDKFEECDEMGKRFYLNKAKEILEAIREPSEDVKNTFINQIGMPYWRAMIDMAIREI